MKKIIGNTAILMLFILCSVNISAQNTKKVLFLGNSYTYENNLPQLLASVAASAGKTVIFDSNTPGSYYLGQHAMNAVSLSKIAAGTWDYVILQDQSMALAYPYYFMNGMQYAVKLDSLIKAANPCTRTMFYSTWGRQNGDMYWCGPPVCDSATLVERTYYEMDSVIETHYKVFADSVRAGMTPVGTVWRYIRRNYPTIVLHQADESHPTLAGSYAAACSFYTTLFRSDPSVVTYNAGLPAADAANIRTAVKNVVYNNLVNWNVGRYDSLLNSSCQALGVDGEPAKEAYWRVFPNPVSDVLHIRFSASGVKDTISIYNALGMLVKKISVTQTTTVNFSELAGGLYIIRSANDQQVFKVFKR